MFKTIAILFLVSFCCYLFFTRQPDYFDSYFTKGQLQKTINDSSLVTYTVDGKLYSISVNTAPEKPDIIYNSSNPNEAAVYTFIGYWIKFPELLISLFIFIGLFASSLFITGKNQPVTIEDLLEPKKRKYNA